MKKALPNRSLLYIKGEHCARLHLPTWQGPVETAPQGAAARRPAAAVPLGHSTARGLFTLTPPPPPHHLPTADAHVHPSRPFNPTRQPRLFNPGWTAASGDTGTHDETGEPNVIFVFMPLIATPDVYAPPCSKTGQGATLLSPFNPAINVTLSSQTPFERCATARIRLRGERRGIVQYHTGGAE